MFKHSSTLILLLLIVNPVELKKLSLGGIFGRGGSKPSAPQSNSGFRPQQNSGFHPPPNNNFHQPHSNFQQPRSFGGAPSFTNHGVGSKSSSGSFGKALAGAAVGVIAGHLAFEAGKAIIKSASTPINYNGRPYYWDGHYQNNPNMMQCSMPLSSLVDAVKSDNSSTTTTTTVAPTGNVTDASTTTTTVGPSSSPAQTLQNIQFQDGTRPKTIVWGCKRGVEICCGSDCCPAPVSNNSSGKNEKGVSLTTVLLLVLLLLLIGSCCCCFIAYCMCRSVFDCILPRDENKYEEGYQAGGQYAQEYPMQQYPDQNGYPQQPYGQQQAYPHQPTTYPQQQPGGYPHQGYPQQPYPNQPAYPQQPYPNQPGYPQQSY